MTSAAFLFRCSLLFLRISLVGTESVYGMSAPNHQGGAVSTGSSSQQASRDVTGTWSGTFQSRQPSFAPFTITVVIHSEASGRLVGTSSVSSDCLRDSTLHVTVSGSNIVLAGGDEEGNHITFDGTIDETGTVQNLKIRTQWRRRSMRVGRRYRNHGKTLAAAHQPFFGDGEPTRNTPALRGAIIRLP